jgi:hypothetical protein
MLTQPMTGHRTPINLKVARCDVTPQPDLFDKSSRLVASLT